MTAISVITNGIIIAVAVWIIWMIIQVVDARFNIYLAKLKKEKEKLEGKKE